MEEMGKERGGLCYSGVAIATKMGCVEWNLAQGIRDEMCGMESGMRCEEVGYVWNGIWHKVYRR